MFQFIIRRFKALGYAWRGLMYLLKTEAAFQVQASIAVLMTAIGFYVEITRFEWIVQFLVIGLVMGLEALNTSIEEIADFIHPDFHHKIGTVKDMAAGAVIFVGIIAVIVAGFIYWPYLFS